MSRFWLTSVVYAVGKYKLSPSFSCNAHYQGAEFMSITIYLPADSSSSWNQLTFPTVDTEMGLQLAQAPAGQPVLAGVAWLAKAVGLFCPLVHYALRKLVTCHEFAGVCPISCKGWVNHLLKHHPKGPWQGLWQPEKTAHIYWPVTWVC